MNCPYNLARARGDFTPSQPSSFEWGWEHDIYDPVSEGIGGEKA